MPQYKVIKKGFSEGHLYDPEGKRRVLTTDKPYKKGKLPSWLAEMPKESSGVKAKREKAEKAQADLDAAKAEQDQKDITNASTEGAGESASFMGEPTAPGSNVETL